MTPNPDSDLVWLTHIRECIEEIHEYTGDKPGKLRESRAIQRAVERVLQILAESTQRIDPALKASEPQIPWQQIAGLRNRLTHGYLNIDEDTIQDIIEQDLPQLATAIARMTERASTSARRAWRDQLERDWPSYVFETSQSGFTLTYQEDAGAERESLGEAQSVEELCELERKHRGWQQESLADIIGYTNAEIQRSRSKGKTR